MITMQVQINSMDIFYVQDYSVFDLTIMLDIIMVAKALQYRITLRLKITMLATALQYRNFNTGSSYYSIPH